MRSTAFGLVLLLSMLGCGGGGEDCCGPPPEPPPGEPPPSAPGVVASVAILSGGTQRAEVAKELAEAVVVRATDASALPVPNQLINFVVVSGGGSVFAGAAQTNALGEARERWMLGTVAGEQVLEARAVDQTTGAPIVFGRITATADPGPPATLTFADTVEFVGGPFGPKEVAYIEPFFLGQQLDVGALVIGAQDQYGNNIAAPPVSVEAAEPFTVTGTTVASVSEVADTIEVVSGAARSGIRVTVVRDLTALAGGRGSWACAGRRRVSLGNDEFDIVIIREAADFSVDSVSYPALSGDRIIGAARLWVTRTLTFTREDGSQRVFPALGGGGLVVSIQEPGMIYIPGGGGNRPGLPPSGPVYQTSDSPLTYVGGPHCNSWHDLTGFEPITITAAVGG